MQLWVMDVDTVLYNARCSFAPKTDDKNRTVFLAPLHVVKVLYKDCLRPQNERLETKKLKKDVGYYFICWSFLYVKISPCSIQFFTYIGLDTGKIFRFDSIFSASYQFRSIYRNAGRGKYVRTGTGLNGAWYFRQAARWWNLAREH